MNRKIIEDATKLVARVLMALLFLWSGYGKITGYEGVGQYMAMNHVSPLLEPIVILTEIGFGLCILFGLITRIAAICLAGFCLLTAYYFHIHPEDQTQMIMLFKNMTMCGGFLVLAASGAGRFSLDSILLKGRRLP
jgi:putative oxidoreductase